MISISRREALSGAVAVLAAAATGSALATGSAPAAQRHEVEIRAFAFVPEVLEVRPGDTIVWRNRDLAPHTASSVDGMWDTGPIKRGKEAELLVSAGMAEDYFCAFHPKMKARVRFVQS